MRHLLDLIGDGLSLVAAGLLVGLIFGAAAAHSQFCLRAASIDLARARLTARSATWLLGFSSAIMLTQAAIWTGMTDLSEARQLSARGSMSGALIGGALFGIGMVLSRGCAARLLVLSATGNLRALVSGLVLTIVAQASLRGVLSPYREYLAGLWTVDGGPGRNLLTNVHGGAALGTLIGAALVVSAILMARRHTLSRSTMTTASIVGASVALAWVLTSWLSATSFEPNRIGSITIVGPSADTLMSLISTPDVHLSFDLGLIPGVFAGALAATLLTGQFRWQSFEGGASMLRYLAGAGLMGFGAMLAGGCSVGAGVGGSAVFATTSVAALMAMVSAAALTDRLLDQPSTADDHGTSRLSTN